VTAPTPPPSGERVPCEHRTWYLVGLRERVCMTCGRAIGPGPERSR
jgi:hypothetical protein